METSNGKDFVCSETAIKLAPSPDVATTTGYIVSVVG
jgi:hypothetical protein